VALVAACIFALVSALNTWGELMELEAYLMIFRRRKWVIVVMVAVAVTVSVIGTLIVTPTYVASTTLRVLTFGSGSAEWTSYASRYTERLMNTYTEVVVSGPMLEELMDRLGLDETPRIEVEILPATELMRITVEEVDPIQAALAANTLAEILISRTRELYTGHGRSSQEILSAQLIQIEHELEQARKEYEDLVAQFPEDVERITTISRSVRVKEEIYTSILQQYEEARLREAMLANTLSVIEPAVVPRSPSKPRKALNIALGFMVGLAGGVGLSFLFENLDTRMYATEQIEAVTALPVLGKITAARRPRQVALFNSNSSANLALAVAQSGRNVIAVDGDLRLPALHRIFDLSNEVGLSSVLKQEATLDEAVQESKTPGVQVLTSGPLPPNPAELIDSPRMAALIEQLAQQFDMVLLDTPSLLAVTDAVVLAEAVDGVVLVVGRAQARREAVRAARQRLADVKARSIGVVVNRAEKNGSSHYYHRTPSQRDE
jgi:capsular exopolysaccharide synthesis family protein